MKPMPPEFSTDEDEFISYSQFVYPCIFLAIVNYILALVGTVIGFTRYIRCKDPRVLFFACMSAVGVLFPLPFLGAVGCAGVLLSPIG